MFNFGKWYTHNKFHVDNPPPEGYLKYALYKIFFLFGNPKWGLKRLASGKGDFTVIGHTKVPVSSLTFTHAVGNNFLDLKLKKRIKTLQQSNLGGTITFEDLNELCPSINKIRVVQAQGQNFVVDGNGRAYALQKTYPDSYVCVELVTVDGEIQKRKKKREKMRFRNSKEPQEGDVRVKKKTFRYANGKIRLKSYYECKVYRKYFDYSGYSYHWEVENRIPCDEFNVNEWLTSTNPSARKIGKVVFKLEQSGKKQGAEYGLDKSSATS